MDWALVAIPDRPDIVGRVFYLKLAAPITALKGSLLRKYAGVV